MGKKNFLKMRSRGRFGERRRLDERRMRERKIRGEGDRQWQNRLGDKNLDGKKFLEKIPGEKEVG